MLPLYRYQNHFGPPGGGFCNVQYNGSPGACLSLQMNDLTTGNDRNSTDKLSSVPLSDGVHVNVYSLAGKVKG